MPVYQIGRLGRIFAAKQTTYGVAPTFAATDAIRHINVQLNVSNNRIESQERNAHPSVLNKWVRRKTGNFTVGGIFYPSGTIGTVPDHTDFLECGLGVITNITPLSTTISSGPTTTGATVASGAGLTIGQAVLINVTTGSPASGRLLRWLTNVAGAVLTWDPPLPQAPAVGDSVKSCVNYSLATALPNALSIGHYLTSISKEGTGAVIDQLKFTFDANNEVLWEASGPMKDRLTAAQSQPGSFTTIGSTPPSGLVGGLRIGSAAVAFLKLEVVVSNTMELDNFQFGTSSAAGFFRKNKRKIAANITAILSDDTTLMTAAETATDNNALCAQCGQTEGSIIGVYGPNLDFDVPAMPDGEETLELNFTGTMKGVTGNDELRVAVA
jgi:hypothetical protein